MHVTDARAYFAGYIDRGDFDSLYLRFLFGNHRSTRLYSPSDRMWISRSPQSFFISYSHLEAAAPTSFTIIEVFYSNLVCWEPKKTACEEVEHHSCLWPNKCRRTFRSSIPTSSDQSDRTFQSIHVWIVHSFRSRILKGNSVKFLVYPIADLQSFQSLILHSTHWTRSV
jgi:hypothetical protein